MQNSEFPHTFLNIYPSAPTIHSGGHHWNGKNIRVQSDELFFVIEGGIVMELNGVLHAVPKNHAIFMPHDSIYSCWRIPGDPLQYYDFDFKSEWNSATFFSTPPFDMLPTVFAFPREKVIKIYQDSLYFSPDNIPQRLNICTQLSNLHLVLAATIWQRKETERLYGDVLSFMRAHMHEDITLYDLAALRDVTPAYFSRKFKETAGVSPQQLLSRMRLWHAASLLKDKGMNPQQVATAVGFSDMYYFKKFFKGFFGVPPERFAGIFTEPNYMNVKR